MIFTGTEIGSLPARFVLASTESSPEFEYQVIRSPILFGSGQGDISRSEFSIILHNTTENLAYIDSEYPLSTIEILKADGANVVFNERLENSLHALWRATDYC